MNTPGTTEKKAPKLLPRAPVTNEPMLSQCACVRGMTRFMPSALHPSASVTRFTLGHPWQG